MWTILCEKTLSNLLDFLEEKGSQLTSYHANSIATRLWCLGLLLGRESTRHTPFYWITSMLEEVPGDRCSAQALVEQILDRDLDPQVLYSFIGRCCTDDDDAAESVVSENSELSTTVELCMTHIVLLSSEVLTEAPENQRPGHSPGDALEALDPSSRTSLMNSNSQPPAVLPHHYLEEVQMDPEPWDISSNAGGQASQSPGAPQEREVVTKRAVLSSSITMEMDGSTDTPSSLHNRSLEGYDSERTDNKRPNLSTAIEPHDLPTPLQLWGHSEDDLTIKPTITDSLQDIVHSYGTPGLCTVECTTLYTDSSEGKPTLVVPTGKQYRSQGLI